MKARIALLFVALLFSLSACRTRGKAYGDEEIEAFDKVLTHIGDGNTKAYDLRAYEDCVAGRIPGFFCMRTLRDGEARTVEEIASDLIVLLGKKHNYRIILIDYDGEDSRRFTEIMNASGFHNIHYFAGGYDRYAELKGEEFTPETGECDGC